MNIQIYGRRKCFETKKAQRYFKERRIPFQYVDLDKYGMSRRELERVQRSIGMAAMLNDKDEDYPLLEALSSDSERLEKLYEGPWRIRTPIVRNGIRSTAGYCPDVWKDWE